MLQKITVCLTAVLQRLDCAFELCFDDDQKVPFSRIMSLSQGRRLNTMCGAKVFLKMISESGRVTSKANPGLNFRTVKYQAGDSSVTPMKSTRSTSNERSRKVVVPPVCLKLKKIKNLPGKKLRRRKPPSKNVLINARSATFYIKVGKIRSFLRKLES